MIIMMSPLQCQQPSSSSPPGFLDSGTNSDSSSESPNRFRPRVLGSEQRHLGILDSNFCQENTERTQRTQRHLGIPHICQENTHHPNLFSEVVIGSAEVANQVLPVRFSEICCEKPFCLLYVCLHLSKALKIFCEVLSNTSFFSFLMKSGTRGTLMVTASLVVAM